MIVVVGSPHLRFRESKQEAAGPAVGVGAAAAAAGARRPARRQDRRRPGGRGGRCSISRRARSATSRSSGPEPRDARDAPTAIGSRRGDPFEELAPESEPQPEPPAADTPPGPTLEPADIELALRYLPDYRVLVVAEPLPPAALEVVVAASRWSGAALVIVLTARIRASSTSPKPRSSKPPRATRTTRSRRWSVATRRRSIAVRNRPKRSPPRPPRGWAAAAAD